MLRKRVGHMRKNTTLIIMKVQSLHFYAINIINIKTPVPLKLILK